MLSLNCLDGGWPEMTYTKCSQFAGGQPIERSLDLMSALKVSEDVWGKIHFSSNGETHMEFTLNVHLQKAMDYSLVDRYITPPPFPVIHLITHFFYAVTMWALGRGELTHRLTS